MSEAIYNRAMVREKAIWPSFLYGMPGVESTKVIVFGLYANTYLLGHNYLEDIETEELQRLVDVYNSNMVGLAADEQSLVLEIASKRYLKIIEIQIKNNALVTKTQQLNADEQEYNAKLAALDVDQEALNTKRIQIELERDQVSIANISLQITQAEVSKSQIDADIAGIDARIASKNLSSKRLEIDQAELDAMQYEVDNVVAQRIELIEAKGDIIENETGNVESLELKEGEIETVQTSEQNARKASAIAGFDDRESMSEVEKEQSKYDDNLDIEIAGERKASHLATTTKRTDIPRARTGAAATRKSAAIAAAKTMATANITSTLTHEIGSA
jgi:hypothetical protein